MLGSLTHFCFQENCVMDRIVAKFNRSPMILFVRSIKISFLWQTFIRIVLLLASISYFLQIRTNFSVWLLTHSISHTPTYAHTHTHTHTYKRGLTKLTHHKKCHIWYLTIDIIARAIKITLSCTCTHTHAPTHTTSNTHTHIYIYIYIYIHVHLNSHFNQLHNNTRTHACTHTHTDTHYRYDLQNTYAYLHNYTYMQTHK